jgi:predicted nucleic acid-binding protein
MTFLCDTTVLFAASDAAHQHHQLSLALVTRATPSNSFVAAHSLAELYATLSGRPAPRMRRVDQVLEAVEHASRSFTPVSLDLDDYLWVMRHVAGVEARSGQIYDALILKCAERADVETVYTWNTRHFKRIAWPEMVERIRTP